VGDNIKRGSKMPKQSAQHKQVEWNNIQSCWPFDNFAKIVNMKHVAA